MIENALYYVLNTTAGVSALVSGRIYPVKLPQNPSYPCITYQQVSVDHVENFSGSAGLAETWIQIDSWAESFIEARDLAEEVRLAWQGYSGCPVSGINVSGVTFHSERDSYEDLVDAYRRITDYLAWHSKAFS